MIQNAFSTTTVTCPTNRRHLVSLRKHSKRFLLIKIIAAKRASLQRSLANGHDDEIASITDFSDDGENEMYANFSISSTDDWLDSFLPISDSVEYLLVLQQIRRKCEDAKGNLRYSSSVQKRLKKHPKATLSGSLRCSLPTSVGMQTQWLKK